MFNLALELAKMVAPDAPKKASLVCMDFKDWSIDPLQYNPENLKLDRSVTWSSGRESLAPYGSLSYTRGDQDTLSFTLMFDRSEIRGTNALQRQALSAIPLAVAAASAAALMLIPGMGAALKMNVLPEVLKLYRLTLPLETVTGNAGGLMRPPVVAFVWGPFQFTGVIESLNFDLNLFDKDGLPRRAKADVKMTGRAMQKVDKVDTLFDPSYESKVKGKFDAERVNKDKRLDLLTNMKKSGKKGSKIE